VNCLSIIVTTLLHTLSHLAAHSGIQFNSGDVTAMFCNMDQKQMKYDPDVIAHMFDQVWCGKMDGPQEGYAQLKYKSNRNPKKYYIYYGPTDALGSCMSETNYYAQSNQSQSCDNAPKPVGCFAPS
jgi:hypothetical protein